MSNEELLSSVLNEGVHDYHIPERVLMLCVILQQLLDATKPTYKGESSYNILLRDRARSWLTSSYGVTATDRDEVCDMAGVSPEALITYTRKLFADGSELKFVRKRINAILHETRT